MATTLIIQPKAVRITALKKFQLELTIEELDKVMQELRGIIADQLYLILDSIKKGRT